ncbi:MAG: hypothetical protein QE285_20445 [Aquabacterium sp.]|nr:hypothetical protein [Aquabacterium sp.]
MSAHPHSTSRSLVTAALLAASLLPVMAQKTGGLGALVYNDYFGPVEPPPNDCNFFEVHIPDGAPRVRPVLQRLNPLITSTQAQVVAGAVLPRGYRQVAYSYSFNRLRLVFPPIYGGLFLVSSVRTVVHAGPTSAYPVASDRTVTGVDSVSFANSVAQRLTSGTGASAINNTWLVRNITTGRWRSEPYMPLTYAQVSMACMMTVKPAATPVLQ